MRRCSLTLAVVVIVGLLAAACGPSKAEIAKTSALTQFQELRNNNLGGQEAQDKAAQIYLTLNNAELAYVDIGTDDDELQRLVEAGWVRTARTDIVALRETKADPEGAKQLKDAIMSAVNKSGHSLSSFDLTEIKLGQQVARNSLEFAQRQGVPVTVAMYRAAGLPPNTRTVTRTRTVVRRVPAPAPRAPTRPPARRRTGG